MNEYLTIQDLMREFSVGRTTAYRIAAAVGFTRIARGAIRVDRDAVKAYMAGRTEPQGSPARKSALAEAKRLAQAALRKIEEAEQL